MQAAPDEIQRRIDRLRDGLAQAGVKLTHQRLEIFREVAQSGDHPDAESIYRGVRERVSTISLDTVYRTLWLLLDLGLLTTLGPSRDRTRFDANTRPHHHFVCTRCGMTRDFYSEAFDRLEIPDAVRELGRVERAQVEIRGTCLSCAEKTNRAQATSK